jgi:hypothetical protein
MKRIGITGLVVGALVVGAYFLGRARAAGVPAQNPMFYAGYLTDTSGQPASGTHGFIVKLYADMTTTSPACTFAAASAVTNGRFRLQLDNSCADAVHANPDLYLELSVDTQAFPRSKLGAVPYALEAANASTVPFSGVSGINSATEWLGTVSPERVLNGTTRGFVRTLDIAGTNLVAAYIGGLTTPPIIDTQTGTWITGVSRPSTGVYDLTFAFAARPYCIVTSTYSATASLTTVSNTTVEVAIQNNLGAAMNSNFFILCVGR